MTDTKLLDATGKLIYRLPESPRPFKNSSLIFSMHRSGSTMTEGIVSDIAKIINLPYVGISTEFFKQGISAETAPASTSEIFLKSGYVYGGFRNFPTSFDIPILDQCPSILLVRDPRDAVTSLYFAEAKSHALPGDGPERERFISQRAAVEKMGIDSFVIDRAPIFAHRLKEYRVKLSPFASSRTYRYEDIIFDKYRFVKEMCWHFGWDLTDSQIQMVTQPYDVIPSSEKEGQHVRQVKPGNFKAKLKLETVDVLNEIFQEELIAYGFNL